MAETWHAFYFEGNLWTGHVQTRAHWFTLLKHYREVNISRDEVLRARKHRDHEDRFGFYAEYGGAKTLKDFFEENGVQP